MDDDSHSESDQSDCKENETDRKYWSILTVLMISLLSLTSVFL